MKRVFLIDAMSHIYRAYFAPMGARQDPLRNSKGQVTQAIFVFTNMLRKLMNDEKPDYIAAIFDTDAPTFRHDSYDAYKANREAMPDELSSQIPFIVQVCEAFGIPILKMDGFEADDVIGTLVKKVADKGMQAVIVSNDKDLCQLVQDPLVVAMRQNSQNVKRKIPVPAVEWCDEKWVQNKFGVPPSKIVDLLGLMGDAVDNIPGAPGIGEKGALKIILEYGSVENAIANAEKITHKTYRESLQNNQEIIRQSLELATIHCEVPIELDLDALKNGKPDRQLAYALFRELEFNALTREFADAQTLFDAHPSDTSESAVAASYNIVRTREDLDKLIRRLFEIEGWSVHVDDSNSDDKSSCFHKNEPLGVGIGLGDGEAFYIDLQDFSPSRDAAIRSLKDILTNGFMVKSAHDIKRNWASLAKIGIEPEAVKDDTMLASYVIDSGRAHHTIPFLAQITLDLDIAREVPDGFEEHVFRTAENADLVARLAPRMRQQIRQNSLEKVYAEIELPLVPILADLEMTGMKINGDALVKFSSFISEELDTLREKIFAIAGREFNIGSPKQVGEIFQELNIDTGRKTATGQVSTSRDVLDEIALNYEIAQFIIDYREMDKLKATYADSLPKMIGADGRIHGCLNQAVAATGRLSSTEPNLQNIPIRTELGQRIRSAFIPEKGNKLISADYSQLELRILAHVTKDPVMLEAFQKGEDIHTKTAQLVFGAKDGKDREKRRLAKIVNFGIAYALEAFGLAQRTGVSRGDARKIIDDYFDTYKGIRAYMDRIPAEAREKGYVTSLFGRRRYFPGIKDRNYSVRSRAEREAINMPIQGTASDIVKIAMIKVAEALKKEKFETKMIMQVHDELLFEAPESEIDKVTELIKREMEAAAELDVPLIVDIGYGDNWMNAK